MGNVLVSIIIPVYNRKKYLGQAIDSVLQQTYQNWELIIADDNSQPETKSFLQSYTTNPKIKVYYNSANLGLFPNLNQAIKKSNGDYITILCSDDFFLPNYLEENLKLMKEHAEAILLISNKDEVEADGKLIPNANEFYYNLIAKETKLFQPDQSVPLLLKYGSINGNITGMFFKKSLYEQVGGFKENWHHAADWEWIYRVASHNPILLSRVNVAVIRTHQEQLSVVNGKNLSASLEAAEMVKMLMADPRLKTLKSAPNWAFFRMQYHLWYGFKLALRGYWSEFWIIVKAVDQATGFGSTFWEMLKVLPQRWKIRGRKGFLLPPD